MRFSNGPAACNYSLMLSKLLLYLTTLVFIIMTFYHSLAFIQTNIYKYIKGGNIRSFKSMTDL